MTSSKKIRNDIADIEDSSDKIIPPSSYFLVYIKVSTCISPLNDICKKLIKSAIDNILPVAGYVYGNELYIIYSCVEDGSHPFGGSQHRIVSHFTSLLCLDMNYSVLCRIVEIDTRTKVIIYLQYKVYENYKKSIQNLSRKTINLKDIESLTSKELAKLFEDKVGHDIASIPSFEKYGTCYKYVADDKNSTTNTDNLLTHNKGKYITLSELFDISDMNKYISYFFG